MLHAQPTGIHGSSAETAEGAEKASPAVVPLAIPIVAGPGAMATVLVTAHGAASTMVTAALHRRDRGHGRDPLPCFRKPFPCSGCWAYGE